MRSVATLCVDRNLIRGYRHAAFRIVDIDTPTTARMLRRSFIPGHLEYEIERHISVTGLELDVNATPWGYPAYLR